MSRETTIRWGWLKVMYIYTIVVAGTFGLGNILMPRTVSSLLGLPDPEPITTGITASVYLAFAVLSVFGLRSPLRFAPVLLLQLVYKSIWFIGVILPMLVTGRFPVYAILPTVVFATYIVGDLIAIPFPYVLAKGTGGMPSGDRASGLQAT